MKTNVSSYGQTIVIRWSKKPMWIFRKLNKLNFILNTHSNIHTDDKKVVRKEKSCFTFQLIEKRVKKYIIILISLCHFLHRRYLTFRQQISAKSFLLRNIAQSKIPAALKSSQNSLQKCSNSENKDKMMWKRKKGKNLLNMYKEASYVTKWVIIFSSFVLAFNVCINSCTFNKNDMQLIFPIFFF